MKKELDLQFTNADVIDGYDGELCYSTGFELDNGGFKEDCCGLAVLTENRELTPDTLHLIKKVYENVEDILMDAVSFLKNELKSDPVKYGILENEMSHLDLSDDEFPVSFPRITFACGQGDSWNLIFDRGQFSVSEPWGILVEFKGLVPVAVEDISKSEMQYPEADD